MNAGPHPNGPDAGKRPEDLRGGARIRMLHVDNLGGEWLPQEGRGPEGLVVLKKCV